MNIVFQTGSSPYGSDSRGGAESSMRLLAEKLAGRGHKVIFINKSSEKNVFPGSKQIINGVRFYQLYDIPLPDFGIGRLKKVNKLINSYCYIFLLKTILKLHKVQIIYLFYELDICLLYLKLRKKYNLSFQFMLRVAGMTWCDEIMKKSSLKEPYQYIFNNADSLNFISEGLYNMFLEKSKAVDFQVSISKPFISDIGVNLNYMNNDLQKNGQDKSTDKFIIIMVGRFVDYAKRQDILVEALKVLEDKIPYEFYFYGSGPTRDKLMFRTEELKLENKVKFIPYVEQSELWRIMGEADLLCHACDYEGLCKTIIESMGVGLPVLASNVTPLNNYIVDGENGFLVDNNPLQWAEKIQYIYENRKDLKKVSQKAKDFTSEMYDAEKNISKYIEEFECLIEEA